MKPQYSVYAATSKAESSAQGLFCQLLSMGWHTLFTGQREREKEKEGGREGERESMENLKVIQVEVIAPEKPLDINTFPKNNPNVDFTIYVVSKYLCVYMASCDIQKYFMFI